MTRNVWLEIPDLSHLPLRTKRTYCSMITCEKENGGMPGAYQPTACIIGHALYLRKKTQATKTTVKATAFAHTQVKRIAEQLPSSNHHVNLKNQSKMIPAPRGNSNRVITIHSHTKKPVSMPKYNASQYQSVTICQTRANSGRTAK